MMPPGSATRVAVGRTRGRITSEGNATRNLCLTVPWGKREQAGSKTHATLASVVRMASGRRSYLWSSGVSVEPDSGPTGTSPFAGVRTILVPPDIVAVEQRPKAPREKKPPWRPRPDAGSTDRAGGRQWFSDRLFVEGQDDHVAKRSGRFDRRARPRHYARGRAGRTVRTVAESSGSIRSW